MTEQFHRRLNGIPGDWVQLLMYKKWHGNMGDTSGTGVFTRILLRVKINSTVSFYERSR